MEDTKLFHEIAAQLQPVLPQEWRKVCLFAEVSANSYELFYYVYVEGRTEPIQCYNLSKEYQLSEKMIDNALASLAKLLRASKAENQQTWTVFTVVLSSDGAFKADYDYDEHLDDMFAYKRAWKKKYLVG